MTGSAKITYTNEGLLVTFENGRVYDVHPSRDGGVSCTLQNGPIELKPFAQTVKGLIGEEILSEIEHCAELFNQKCR
ncbi:hypothetical protein [Methanogenium cariaci]|jgi:hypothetical protein